MTVPVVVAWSTNVSQHVGHEVRVRAFSFFLAEFGGRTHDTVASYQDAGTHVSTTAKFCEEKKESALTLTS